MYELTSIGSPVRPYAEYTVLSVDLFPACSFTNSQVKTIAPSDGVEVALDMDAAKSWSVTSNACTTGITGLSVAFFVHCTT